MKKRLFLNNWEFYLDQNCGLSLPEGTLAWEKISLPHDWQIWDSSDLYADGTGWYKKTFSCTPIPGQRTQLFFEGVYMDTAVFVNGKLAGEWKYGYSSFRVDLTGFLVCGENEILVRCCVLHPNSRWYSGAGIYRRVWLFTMPWEHLIPDGFYIAAREQSSACWKVDCTVQFSACERQNKTEERRSIFVDLRDASGRLIAGTCVPLAAAERVLEENAKAYAVGEKELYEIRVSFSVENPELWDLAHPYCYQAHASLMEEEQVLDQVESVFGFRTIEVFPDRGFWLNHRRVLLHGVCNHHDLGCLGAEFHVAAARRQIEILKEMGVNAIRTAHNMPAPELMDLADEMGILIVNEAFDCWENGKNAYDYHRFFWEWSDRDVASWVRRDRNHPSLILWSIGNEIYDTHKSEKGQDTTRYLIDLVKQHDPAGNGIPTFGSNYLAWENTQNCADIMKVVGYNYGEKLYDDHHKAHPDWIIYGSETASILQSRGIYHFPLEKSLLSDDDLQCSDLGNSTTSWGAANTEAVLAGDAEHPYSMGQFLWSGFDYIGEPTPYHTKNSYLGQIDTAGFPKNSFYRYQAAWTCWQEKPMIHLLPYWDYSEGQKIDLVVISNAPEVELFLNDQSLGRKKLDGIVHCAAAFQATYHPGTVRAVAYDPEGNILCSCEEHSFGNAAAIAAEADKNILKGDGEDILFLTVSMKDKDGYPVKNANNRIHVSVEGPALLLGLDNGNSADVESYKISDRKLFSGKLLCMIGGKAEGGQAKITLSSPGLPDEMLEVTVLGQGERIGDSQADTEIRTWKGAMDVEPVREIPIRKIELTADHQILTPNCQRATIQARILPEQATLREIRWKLTDELGLETTNLIVEEGERKDTIHVLAKGDGTYRVRCYAMNGQDFPEQIFSIELQVSGMGQLYPDPYAYIGAKKYFCSQGEITNGNELGIATSRTETCWVAYEHLNFGKTGSDTIALDVFELEGEETAIYFWEGIPYAEGSSILGTLLYHKPKKWNVYQRAEYHFSKILTGEKVIGIELRSHKIHLKGFIFTQKDRTWDSISALDRVNIYGDSFREEADHIADIGNNVSLIFENFDFGSNPERDGTNCLTICGRSELETNTIHVLFQNSQGETSRRIVEFHGCTEFTEQNFDFDPVFGSCAVTLLFLPGSRFDLKYFTFSKRNKH